MIQVGDTLGPYAIEDKVGQGGMAGVYRAYHAPTDRHVAVKVMRPEIAADATFRQRFEREAKVLAGLQHVHILPVFDYGQEGDVTYLVMPMLTGKTLGERIRESSMSLPEVSRLFRQLANALDYAHNQGVIHRDIKPANIMLDDSGNALLADFGLTRLLGVPDQQLTTDSTVIGTPLYMSPEQGQGKPMDHRSDLYSLSVVLYEMITGDVPFKAETPVAIIFRHASDPIPSAVSRRADLPLAVETVLEKGLAKSPDERYSTASAMADAFDEALSDATTRPVISQPDNLDTIQAQALGADIPTPVLVTKPRETLKNASQKRGLWTYIAAILLLVIGGGVGGYALTRSDSEMAEPSFEFTAHDGGLGSLAVSASGAQLITGGADGFAYVWDLNDLTEPIHSFDGHGGNVRAVGIRPGENEYLTAAENGSEFHWDAETGELKLTNMTGTTINHNLYSADGSLLASVYVKTLSIGPYYDPYTMEFSLADVDAELINPNDSNYSAIAFYPDIVENEDGTVSYRVATADNAGYVQQWAVTYDTTIAEEDVQALLAEGKVNEIPLRVSGELLDNVEMSSSRITQVAYSPDGSTIAASSENGLIRIVDSESMEQVRIFPDTYGQVYDIAFNPEGTQLAAATESSGLLLWDIEAAQVVQEQMADERVITRVVYAQDGTLLAGTENGVVLGWRP
jgi:serine/threonine protein kinase